MLLWQNLLNLLRLEVEEERKKQGHFKSISTLDRHPSKEDEILFSVLSLFQLTFLH